MKNGSEKGESNCEKKYYAIDGFGNCACSGNIHCIKSSF